MGLAAAVLPAVGHKRDAHRRRCDLSTDGPGSNRQELMRLDATSASSTSLCTITTRGAPARSTNPPTHVLTHGHLNYCMLSFDPLHHVTSCCIIASTIIAIAAKMRS